MSAPAAEPVRWGLLGAGRITRDAVGPALAASGRGEVVAVGARDAGRAAAVAPGARTGSYEDVVADPEVEAVYIGLANDAHVPWALRALRAGKHVLCEKPLGMRAEEVAAAVRAATDAGVELVEASWYRWHPRTRHAEDIVASGALGDVVEVRAGFCFGGVPEGDYRLDPAMGGGAAFDVGCYALSAVGWATGWGPVGVAGVDVRRHPSGVDLELTARLQVGAATAEVGVGIDTPDAQWLEVVGTAGSLSFGQPAFTAWTGGPVALTVAHPTSGSQEVRFPACDPYLLMVDAVAGRVRGGGDWVVPTADTLWVAQATDAVLAAGSAP